MANEKRVPRQTGSTTESQSGSSNIIVPRHVREQIKRDQAAREAAGAPAQQKPPVTLADIQQGGGEAAVRRGTDAANTTT